MSLRTLWLDARELKGLRTDIEYLDAEELKEELDAAIEENKGNYLCNILSYEAMRELEKIKENYFIMVFLKHGIQKKGE